MQRRRLTAAHRRLRRGFVVAARPVRRRRSTQRARRARRRRHRSLDARPTPCPVPSLERQRHRHAHRLPQRRPAARRRRRRPERRRCRRPAGGTRTGVASRPGFVLAYAGLRGQFTSLLTAKGGALGPRPRRPRARRARSSGRATARGCSPSRTQNLGPRRRKRPDALRPAGAGSPGRRLPARHPRGRRAPAFERREPGDARKRVLFSFGVSYVA